MHSLGTTAGQGVGVCPWPVDNLPGVVESGATWVYTPNRNIFDKVEARK